MESSSDYKISNSSLLSLKAEVLRKQQEIASAKNQVKLKQHAILKSKLKTSTILPKNKGVEERQAFDEIDDEEILEKSKRMLMNKTKLYNKLMKSPEDFTEEEIERNKQFLVKFDEKRFNEDQVDEDEEENHLSDEYEPSKNPEEEWVEYTDCLGRTRKCLQIDLDFMRKKDSELSKTLDSNDRRNESNQVQSNEVETVINLTENNELLSSDMRRELMRREWEKQEHELSNKKDVHYQDVLFSEARTHGVGYYAFSTDIDERAKQQEELKKLRIETSRKQELATEQKQLREKQLAARLAAARNRKRARLGLPPEENEPVLPPAETKVVDDTEENLEKEKEEKEKEKKRKKHIRPWDIGKEGVVKKPHYEYTQEEWVDKKRAERIKEFAPPSLHPHRIVEEDYEEPSNLLFFTSKKKKKIQQDFTIPPPNFNEKQCSINPYKNNDDSDEESYDIQPPPSIFKPAPIVDECIDFDDEQQTEKYSIRDSDNDSSESLPVHKPQMSNKELEESIAAGLKYLREMSEKREAQSNKNEFL